MSSSWYESFDDIKLRATAAQKFYYARGSLLRKPNAAKKKRPVKVASKLAMQKLGIREGVKNACGKRADVRTRNEPTKPKPASSTHRLRAVSTSEGGPASAALSRPVVVSGGPVEFIVDVSNGPCVRRRYSDFLWLRFALSRYLPGICVPCVPQRAATFRTSLEQRMTHREALENFLNALISVSYFRASPSFVAFISQKGGYRSAKRYIERCLRTQSHGAVCKRLQKLFPHACSRAKRLGATSEDMRTGCSRLLDFLLAERKIARDLFSSTSSITKAYESMLDPAVLFSCAVTGLHTAEALFAKTARLEKVVPLRKHVEFLKQTANRVCAQVKGWKQSLEAHFRWEMRHAEPIIEALQRHEALCKEHDLAFAASDKVLARLLGAKNAATGQAMSATKVRSLRRLELQASQLVQTASDARKLLAIVTVLLTKIGMLDVWSTRVAAYDEATLRFFRLQKEYAKSVATGAQRGSQPDEPTASRPANDKDVESPHASQESKSSVSSAYSSTILSRRSRLARFSSAALALAAARDGYDSDNEHLEAVRVSIFCRTHSPTEPTTSIKSIFLTTSDAARNHRSLVSQSA